ncbi:unnamed protein product [Aureobasidium uvarum]|uniref:Zn(2)-C6 fungal-type domain-containing protein n=1 Tax=Aureobasidium uvarum TaxID=2773716 RepID=A0A9N8KN17_9PEZI|nr:unnamed protein product [Aureobasidium uvarum]
MDHFTDTESSSAPPLKRKRVVTACLECYRRKQKCDREKPCQNCIGSSPTALQSGQQRSVSAEDNILLSGSAPNDTALSSFYDVHAFTDLKKLLEDDEVFQVSKSARIPLDQSKLCSKFWVLAAQLPDPQILTRAFKYYFDEVHWRYNVGQKYYMYKQLEEWTAVVRTPASQRTGINKDSPYFVAFSFELLAVTLQYMQPDREIARLLRANDSRSSVIMSQKYHGIASELMQLLGRHNGTITVVDYDLLRASWLKNNGRGIESWYAISDGVRQAQQLNLHREPRPLGKSNDSSKTLEQFWLQEYGRRVWINLFCWDSGTAMNLGRPRMINAKDCDIILPMDQSFPNNPSLIVPIPKDEHTPSPLSLLLVRYSIAGKIHEIREHGLDKQDAGYSSVWTLHNEFNNLLDSLPPYLNPIHPDTYLDSSHPYLPLHREEALSLLNLVIMELHRPFIAIHPKSREAALEAAAGSIDNQKALMKLSGRHHYVYFGFGFYTTNAAIMLAAIALIYPDESQIKTIESKVQQALSILVNIQSANIVARAAMPVIQRLYDRIRLSSQIDSSESTRLNSPGSVPSQDSGYIPMATSLMDPAPAEPAGTEFMLENAGDLALQDFTALPDWNNMSHVNDFDAAFWLDQLNKMPDNMPLNGVFGQGMMW